MKHYQDTKTGQIYAFEDNINPYKLNNRNLPIKTLTDNVKEKPNENYIWYKGDWVHKNEVPKNYSEPISEIPCFSPAWVSFLFPVGTIVVNDSVNLDIDLNQINSNQYNWKEFSKIILSLPDINGNDLPILVTVDGAVMLPNCEKYYSKKIAFEEINKIRGALFLGGLLIPQVDIEEIYQGKVEEGGRYSFLYNPSFHNRIRLGGSSISERISIANLNKIKVDKLKQSYNIGRNFFTIQTELNFLIKGYFDLLGYSSSALLNLWIVVEKAIDKIWENQKDTQDRKMLKKIKYNDRDIDRKILFLRENNTLEDKNFQVLNNAREKRNDLIHSAIIPEIKVVEKLWVVLFDLIKIAYNFELNDLKNETVVKDNKQKEIFNRRNKNYLDETVSVKRNFDDWKLSLEN
ncbi:MAG: hypothetical protein WA916_02880 [Arcobacter sp.]|uniref:hypothetical protein n=1 Tax=Arcobacter sp. TaxID=1872629 RepID=UPI003C718B10